MLAARFRSCSTLAGFATAVVSLAACSGAGNEDLFEGSGDPTSSATNAIDPTPSPSASGTASGSPGGVLPPAAEATPPKPGDDAPPAGGCTPEVEPNDERARATVFTTSFCGKIASSGDVDHGRFTVPAGKNTIVFKIDAKGGKVSHRFFAGALAAQPDGDEIRVIPGVPYTVQIKLANGEGNNRPSYEVAVSFK